MGLGHVLGLDDGGQRWLCGNCGRIVSVDVDADRAGDDGPTCPDCGSSELRRLKLL